MSQIHSSNDETDFKTVSKNNYQRIQEKVEKINYADGIADGREQSFQSSFDQGYSDGLKTGIELTKFSAFYDTLTKANIDDNLAKEHLAYKKMRLAKAIDKIHFKYLEHQSEPLSIVSEKQNAYVDNLLEHCADALHTTTNLFKSQAK
ncbi:PREDICTED: uncharacterized protein LOC108608701 [Drosophila arizonae]|uniref:Uncharacterized protein LOC108608701 n=1 Tax=Drosophila arizonae TaxID=7263 RepID=A0ABM1NL61_DROAR|nr:PREDICTED: uncharacterized protein LOC108608701 [Drosophila arizonae]